jgi:glutamate racemase
MEPMSKKHYEFFAELIKSHMNTSFKSTGHALAFAKELSVVLAEDNENFCLAKFCKACGFNVTGHWS